MKLVFNSYWSSFYTVVIILTAIDYIDHITRPDPFFLQYKFDWLLFTVASTTAVCLAIAMVDRLTIKILKTTNLFLQSIAIVTALLIHIYITGPLNNKIFFPQAILDFFPNVVIFSIGLGLFYVTRLSFYAFSKFNQVKS